MKGISKGERWILALTAGFLLTICGWFLLEQNTLQPYRVTVAEDQQAEEAEQVWPDSLLAGERINLNTADHYDLARLPGIGEKRAQAIMEYRESYGPFARVEDLTLVSGIGEGILAGTKDYITVDPAK